MALVEGNVTTDLQTPGFGGSPIVIAHNQDAGSDKYIVVISVMANTTSYTGCTYNGTAMTEIRQDVSTSYGRMVIYGLATSDSGSNNVSLSLAADQYNPVSTMVVSFTGCGGVGNDGFTEDAGPPATTTYSVSENSVIIGHILTGTATSTSIEIPNGTTIGLDITNANVNNIHNAGVSGSLSSGSVVSEGNGNTTVAIQTVEITEAGGGGPTDTLKMFHVW